MKDYKNIDEVVDYIQSLLQKENEDITDINEYHKIFKFSAEKLAKKFDLDETKLVNDFNLYKKQIYKKIIIFDKVKELKKKTPTPFNFYSSGIQYKTKVCVCYKFFEAKFKHHTFSFYPQVKYLYVELEDTIVIFPKQEHIKLYSTKKEFNEHFLDMREFKINQIIT